MVIDIVGIGLDGTAGLTTKVLEVVAKATLLVGSDRHLGYFAEHQAERLILGNFLEVIDNLRSRLEREEFIVVLVSGDPLFFGLGRLLLEHFPPTQLRFYPHLSSIQLAFSSIKVAWQDAKIISSHGRSLDELVTTLQQGTNKIALLTDSENNPVAIARLYLALGIACCYDFWVCENLGSTEEKINYFSTKDIQKLASLEKSSFATLNVVILIRQNQSQEIEQSLPILGLADENFLTFSDRPGLMTKREIRLFVLGELSLQPRQIIWDIGSGTGSVSLEIARLCPTSQIYAIEKTAMGITLIEQNSQKLQVSNVFPIHGNAPEVLEKLPQPDRIFIGGSGGNLAAILDFCLKKLRPKGFLVLALTTLEHTNICFNFFNNHKCGYRLLQLQISKSIPVGRFTRLNPLNPVTIITVNY